MFRRNRPRIMVQAVALAILLLQMLPGLVAAAPPAPLQVSPADGSPIPTGTMRPSVSWQASDGATQYAAEIADNTLFYGPIGSGWTPGLSFTPFKDLDLNTLYYWRVKAVNSGGVSDPSPVWRFWMPLTLSSPADGTALTSLTPTLSWSTYRTGTDATTRSYRVQVSQDPSFASVTAVDGFTTSASYVVPSGLLLPSQTYYWRVNVSSADGTSGWSDIRSFSTPLGAPPAPSLVSPGNGTTLDTWRPLLSWNPTATALSYRVHCLRTGNSEWISADLSATSFLLDTFTVCGATPEFSSYEWWVEARNTGGSSFSSHRTFTTPSRQQPSTPVLLGPADGATINDLFPVFDWTDTTYTKDYNIQVGTGATPYGITGVLANVTTSASTLAYPAANYSNVWPLDYNTTYYWRVASYTIGYMNSAVSANGSFRTPPPPGTGLTAPANGAILTTRTPTLSWASAAGALSYRVQMSTSDSFAAPLAVNASVDATGGSSYTIPTALDYNTTYYWRANFTDSLGTSNWSAVWSFRTPPPPGPSLTSPANGTTVETRTPTLSWDAVLGALSYHVQLSASDDFTTTPVVDATVDAAGGSYTVPSALSYNTMYRWRVSFTDATGTSLWSTIWSLRTPPPPGPDLVSPANGSVLSTRTPTLSWSPATGALSYHVQVSTSGSFATAPVVDAMLDATSGNSYPIPAALDYNITYFWRVSFTDSAGTSVWSAVWSFQGPPPVPLAPAPQSPGSSSGGSIVGFRPSFDWADSAIATSYGFQMATDAAFTARIVDTAGLGSSSFSLTSDLIPSTTYYWRANASNNTGTGDWSTTYSFSTPLPPPGPPTLLTPSAGSTTLNLRPHFDWTDSAGATSYTLQIYTDAGLTNLATSITVAASEYTPVAELASNTPFYWRVQSANETSLAGPWSEAVAFSTPAIPVPDMPTLLTPTSGALLDTLTPTLDWQDDSHSNGYRVQISKSSLFSPLVADVTVSSSSYVRPTWMALDVDSNYYWRVLGINATGQGQFSDAWIFQTPAVPAVPVLLSPADGAVLEGVTPTLTLDTVPGATSYTIQLSTVPWFSGPIVATSSSPIVPLSAPLTYNKLYYWRANASNAAGTSVWSGTSTLTTPLPPPPPDAPTPLSPITGVVGDARPTLQWSDVASATQYRVEWSKNATFQWSEASRDNLTASSFMIDYDLQWNTPYYWRVRASGPGGDSVWSPISGFQTPGGPPALPSLLSPADGTGTAGPLQRLDWSDASNADSYELQIATDATFGETVVNTTVTTSEFTPSAPLADNTTYYWRVKAVNGVGDSGWTTSFSFVVPLPPGSVILVAPDDGTTVETLMPVLDWEDVVGATGYDVKYAQSAASLPGVSPATISISSYTIPSKLPLDADYYWQVRAINGSGAGQWSTARQFRTPLTPPIPPAPAAPNLEQPANGATLLTTTPTFTWDAAAEADGYYVELSTDPGFATLVGSYYTTALSHTLSAPLSPATTYYWRVRAENVAGSTNSVSRTLSTPLPTLPSEPVLSAPDNGPVVDALTPTFDWQDAALATGYQIQLSKSSSFSPLVSDVTVSDSTYVRPSWQKLDKDMPYYWRVRSTNVRGSGPWSETWSFRTPAMPTVPTLASPADLAVLDVVTPTLTLDAVPGATSYTIQVSLAPWFSGAIVVVTSAPEAQGTTLLAFNKLYYWRANASNAAGTSAWSATRTFTTPPPPAVPVAPTPLSPNSTTKLSGTRPTLDWEDVAHATKYRVEWSKSATFSWTEAAHDNLTESTFTLDYDLPWNTQYYWRVRGTGLGGDGPWSAITPFKTPLGPPGIATLLSPADGSTATTLVPKLDWSDAFAAESYQVQVATDPAFGTTTIDSSVTASELIPTSSLGINTTYYWRVKTSNTVGESAWTSAWSLVIPPPPSAPSLLLPDDQATVTTLKPTLDWDDTPTAISYEVRYSRSNTFAWGVTSATITVSTYTIPSNLALGVDFYWQVRALNAAGAGPWSAMRMFYTPTIQPCTAVPAVPNLLGPANGALYMTVTPTFSWDAADCANGGYHVQISTDSGFRTLVSNEGTPTTSHTLIAALNYSTKYYWRIQALNSIGASYSATRSLTTDKPPAPNAPTLLSPADGSTANSLSPAFDWADSLNAVGYRIQVSTSNSFGSMTVNSTLSASQYTPPAWTKLVSSTTYYWRVQGYNASGSGDWSPTASFITPAPPPPPATPTLTSPGVPVGSSLPLIDSLKPAFVWGTISEAVAYKIQVSRNAGFTSLLVNTTSTGATYMFPTYSSLAKNTQYWWRVQATNSAGLSPWSDVYTFRTMADPAIPVLSGPANASTVGSLTPTLEWGNVDGAMKYHIIIATTPWFGTKVADVDVMSGSSFTPPTDLAPGMTYYWRVNATNPVATSAWSATWSFKTPS